MKSRIYLSLMLSVFLIPSCVEDQVDQKIQNYSDAEFAIISKSLDLPKETEEYTFRLPDHLGASSVFADQHQATLGRVLFYDKRLSANDKISCASCHKPEKAFADDVAFSEGFAGEHTARNSLALGAFPSFNAYYGFGGTRMFWDERAATVSEQSRLTLRDPVEMGTADLEGLYNELIQEAYYKILFEKAFPEINYSSQYFSNENKILRALDVFVSSIGCFNTRYDQELKAVNTATVTFPGFTDAENRGKALFNQNCASCHNLGAGFATTITAANNGLDIQYVDRGIAELTNNPSDDGVFKVPMLRNVALTAPYMHDGRFSTLEEVVEHYSSGVADHDNLHELLKTNGSPKRLHLSAEEKSDLVAFLHTLTDEGSLAQTKYADPFK